MSIPATLRVFIAGSSGSGKSTAAWKFYLQHFPRRILLDFTGEWDQHADVVVHSVQELSVQMRKLAPRGRWTISAALDGDDDIEELVDYLIPVPRIEDSPIRKIGGAVLLIDEVDLVAPARSMRQEVRTLYRRSRHAGLSIVSTTQRPESVSREVSSQSQQVMCLQLIEPAALDYMADIMRVDLSTLPAWWKANPHGGLWRDVMTGRSLWLSEDGQLKSPSTPERTTKAFKLPGDNAGVEGGGQPGQEHDQQPDDESEDDEP